MQRRTSSQLVLMYVLSLAATIALLVVWIVYVIRSFYRLHELGARVGAPAEFNWITLSVGCALLFFLIVGLTYQLAQALAARRHTHKQEEFVSNITHEMKSPVAAIKLHAQTLQQTGVREEDSRRSLEFIVQQADRMGSLVDNVLESSRLIARKGQLDLAPVSLRQFFDSYLEEARPYADSHGVVLTAEVDTRALVLATDEALRRVLDNLIDNAARFSRPGGEVRCRVCDRGSHVQIEVEDDGAGIPKKELAHVFDRFYQVGKEGDPRRKGTGLGLSIVSGLVREMHGTVRAFSQEERPGSRFVIELPVMDSAWERA